jgi:hypothetical protein
MYNFNSCQSSSYISVKTVFVSLYINQINILQARIVSVVPDFVYIRKGKLSAANNVGSHKHHDTTLDAINFMATILDSLRQQEMLPHTAGDTSAHVHIWKRKFPRNTHSWQSHVYFLQFVTHLWRNHDTNQYHAAVTVSKVMHPAFLTTDIVSDYNREVPGSNLGQDYPVPPRKHRGTGKVSRLSHTVFLPNPFQFMIHHSTLRGLATDSSRRKLRYIAWTAYSVVTHTIRKQRDWLFRPEPFLC